MVTSTIAAVFGFLEIFGLGMIIGEKIEDYLKYRVLKNLNIDAVVNNREILGRNFNYGKNQTKRKDLRTFNELYNNIKTHTRSKSIFPSPFDVANTTQISEL